MACYTLKRPFSNFILFLIILSFNFRNGYLWPIREITSNYSNNFTQKFPTIQNLPHCSKAIVTVSQTSRCKFLNFILLKVYFLRNFYIKVNFPFN